MKKKSDSLGEGWTEQRRRRNIWSVRLYEVNHPDKIMGKASILWTCTIVTENTETVVGDRNYFSVMVRSDESLAPPEEVVSMLSSLLSYRLIEHQLHALHTVYLGRLVCIVDSARPLQIILFSKREGVCEDLTSISIYRNNQTTLYY